MSSSEKPIRTGIEIDIPGVHAAVDRIVLAHGAYLPVELLLERGRLEYRAYEAWRTGDESYLEDVLLGNPTRIREMLRVAAQWAGRLGLVAQSEAQEGWGAHAGAAIQCARDRELEELVTTSYQRHASTAQRDLFMDGSDAVMLSDLRRALGSRDSEGAASRLDQLLRRAPEHRLRPAAERLCDSLAHLAAGTPIADPSIELERLRGQLAADAQEVLGGQARDFAAPFWRRLASDLGGSAHPFDPAAPELHESFAYGQCLDWSAVCECILATAGFEREPVLLGRLVKAEYRRGERVTSLRWLAELCWRWPGAGETLLDAATPGDPRTQASWEAFRDLSSKPIMDAAWFPAWLLMGEPGLATRLVADPPGSSGAASAGFVELRALIQDRENGLDEKAIAGRRRLREAHPLLLAEYLKRLG